ncbi:PREDICTED: uncharacterized protein LOC109166252 [Ipomoea nil]|uniref:uncharacterized protein LOC109166252 n=1 Tax=Ipomoea nil TaxID=35883 RepID=UPI000901227C|nr:PREDICTED: uncharacterized protein LOC109166252 [Ipomoea nil]
MATQNAERGTGYANFLYAFWAFKPAIDGFRYCIPVICVDGTHLYNRYKGHLLLAYGYTANKEIYPLADSIVDSENNASWTCFLRLLAKNVFPHHNSMCIVSDRHAGIDVAFNSVQQLKGARVKRRFCLRHIRSNVMSRVTKNRQLRKLVREAGTTVTRDQFLQHMQAIQIKWPAAYTYLADIDVDKWTLSHDNGHRYGIMTTNPSESLNNSLKCCRMLPVTAIVRMTFHKLRTMFADRRTAGEGMQQHGLRFTTNITDDLSARNNEASGASVQRFNDALGIYGVALNTGYVSQSQQNHFQVNLTEHTCNCGLWNVNGLPCAHVIAACNYRGQGFGPLVPEVYSVENYRNCYVDNFYPVDERIQCIGPVTCLPPISARQPNQRGQRRTRRYPNEMDFGSNQSRRCRYCQRTTHSSPNCPTLNHQ